MTVKSRKMDISGEIPASVPVTAAEIFIVVEMASAAAAGMGPCAARPVSEKSDAKEGSNAVKAALGETAAEEVFSGVKAGFVSRALEAGPPAVFPAETGAINE